jgi:hypothetical protein
MRYNQPTQEVLYIGPPLPNRLGRAGLWTALLGFFTCGVLSPIGLVMSLWALRKAPRGAAVAGVLFGLAGTAFVAVAASAVIGAGMANAARQEAYARRVTHEAMTQAEGVIESYRNDTARLPEGIEGNKLVLQFQDAWKTELRFDLENDAYAIRSAGPDRQFDTPDDLVETHPTPEAAEASE